MVTIRHLVDAKITAFLIKFKRGQGDFMARIAGENINKALPSCNPDDEVRDIDCEAYLLSRKNDCLPLMCLPPNLRLVIDLESMCAPKIQS